MKVPVRKNKLNHVNVLSVMSSSKNPTLMADDLYDKIFAFVLSQEISPGDRLSVDDLVRRFGVSQTPVRQALTRLQMDGLVNNIPNSGFRVSDLPTRQHLLDTLEFRRLFEPSLVALASQNMTDTLREELRKLADDMKVAANGPTFDLFTFFQADAQFHLLLVQASGNEAAHKALSGILRESTVFRRKYESRMPMDVIDEHVAVIDAMVEGNAAKARIAMDYHLQISIARISELSDPD